MNIKAFSSKATSLIRILQVISLLSFCSLANAEIQIIQDNITNRINFTEDLARLRRAWETGSVSRIEVLNISTNVEFIGNISSSVMEAHYGFRLSISDAKESALGEGIFQTVSTINANLSERVSDLRWGFIFYTGNQDRVFAIFFDRTGKRGVVNGACVNFNSERLKTWAESTFGTVFR